MAQNTILPQDDLYMTLLTAQSNLSYANVSHSPRCRQMKPQEALQQQEHRNACFHSKEMCNGMQLRFFNVCSSSSHKKNMKDPIANSMLANGKW